MMNARTDAGFLEEISYDDCLQLLRVVPVGRISVVVDTYPVVLPINYRLVETSSLVWIAIRTRAGNVIDRAPINAAFEIDGIESAERQGWSVLVQGTLHHVDPDAADFREHFDPHPWLGEALDSWMVIEPFAITGRRLHGADADWAYEPQAHL
jgi:hypothetical protein